MMLTPIEQIAMANDATRSIDEKKKILSKRKNILAKNPKDIHSRRIE